MNKNLGPQILKLREEGKTYQEIVNILGTNKGTVSYHCGKGQKEKSKNRNQKRRKKHPFISRLSQFNRTSNNKKTESVKNKFSRDIYQKIYSFQNRNQKDSVMPKNKITLEELLEKIGPNPTCYLTGDKIDIYDTKSYHFDHITPLSRGGDSSLENLGLCTREANLAKSGLTPELFFELCKKVVKHNS